ncbi:MULTISPECIES: helix-turn-helix domain-containing protein [Metabacillus]|uniref:helix-turn-helix domain-containing protein n=1 Tax=Metabacillus TaxID=2675233 RepID=UPI00158E3575|nr:MULTISPECIES: helix-turn-helix transcriptional regulator [Metabacillus]MCM3443989.1 helix-turn-helix transcriptional regulator [Metabacillus halosaccharovorans]
MFGLTSTKKTKFGRYLDRNGIKQSWLAQKAKVSQGYISKLANDQELYPSIPVAKRIIKVLKQKDSYIEFDKFW